MRQPHSRPPVYPDPVPSPLSEGSSLRATSPLDTGLEQIALVEMTSPVLAFAPILREANSIGHHGSPSQLRISFPSPARPANPEARSSKGAGSETGKASVTLHLWGGSLTNHQLVSSLCHM
jgi:hypothetical protein